MTFFALSLLDLGVPLSMVCAVAGLAFAIYLIGQIRTAPAGNARMQEIAGAIQEGAKAYLNRQVMTISVIAVILLLIIGFAKDWWTATGFLIGAVCSLAAGFIGMRVAVLANVRTAQGAIESRAKAMQAAFSGGAVTGLLVVGLALLAVSVFYAVVSLSLIHI
jgi:K(+)-stimulated pyrophosphate-energized sodium pump